MRANGPGLGCLVVLAFYAIVFAVAFGVWELAR
jgi:hypothetical protein